MGERLRSKNQYIATVGADFSIKTLEMTENNIKQGYNLLIWDIAGERKFSTVRSVYYQGSFGVLLVFDLTRKESFDDLENWVESIEKSTQTRGVPLVLLGNKVDLTPLEINQNVKNDQIAAFVTKLNKRYEGQFNVQYFETSAISGKNVEKAFISLIREIKAWLPIRNHKLKSLNN